jgi:hypothetical protein
VGEEFRTYRWGADPTENQQRLTVHDAARRLGISEDAVRMRVKRGTLSANKEGGRLYVLLDIEPTTAPTTEPTTDRTDELIEELKDRAHRLEYQLDQEREARTEERRRQDTVIAQLSRANEEQARTIRQLEAPTSAQPAAPEADQEAPLAPQAPEAGSSTEAPPPAAKPHSPGLTRAAVLAALLPRPQRSMPRRTYVVVVLASAIPGFMSVVSFIPIAALNNVPLVLAFWLSIRWLGRHTWSYVYSGLIIAGVICGLTGGFIVLEWLVSDPDQWFYDSLADGLADILPVGFINSIGPALLFVAGGILGDLVKSWAAQQAPAGEYPVLPGERATAPGEKTWITIAVAVITVVGNVVVAVVGG